MRTGAHMYKALKGTSCSSILVKEEVYTKKKILPIAENLPKVW